MILSCLHVRQPKLMTGLLYSFFKSKSALETAVKYIFEVIYSVVHVKMNNKNWANLRENENFLK